MNVLVRADASPEIGAGHVMRCITICDALLKQGARCIFLARSMPTSLAQQLRQKGHELRILPPISAEWSETSGDLAHSSWLGTTQLKDAEDCLQAIEDQRFDWLIVDHYALDHQFENTMRQKIRNVMVIDDLADRMHECDVLLDQNIGRSDTAYAGLISNNCIVLAGPDFALLRDEFKQFRDISLNRRREYKIKHISISIGAYDYDNYTYKALQFLDNSKLDEECKISVIMGAHAPWENYIRSRLDQFRFHVEINVGVSHMAKLLTTVDLAIGAAGGSALERCCLGIPSLVHIAADNQRSGAKALELAGAAKIIQLDEIRPSEFDRVFDIFASSEALKAMSIKASAITDGLGVSRILEFIQ